MSNFLCRCGALAAFVGLLGCGCSSLSPNWTAHLPGNTSAVPVGVVEFTKNAAKEHSGVQKLGKEADPPLAKISLVLFQPLPAIDQPPKSAEKSLQIPDQTDPKAKGGAGLQTEPQPMELYPGQVAEEIDFATALALASGQNPRVGFAQAQIQEAVARIQAANVLWLPSINAGVNYNKHEGRLQQSEGSVEDISRNAFSAGLGTGNVGAGSPRVAGLSANFHLADAIFLPRIAGSEASARQAAFTATLNDTLLVTSLTYLDLLESHQQRAIASETLKNAQLLADLTKKFAETGQGNQADAQRAKVELMIRQNDAERAKEAVQVASARLAQNLSLPQMNLLEPREPTLVPIQLVALEAPLPDLVASALTNRPELAESRFLVTAAIQALKREKFAPLVPSILLGVSESGFGGGPNSSISNYNDRFDFDAILYWQIRNLGFGELAARKQVSARARQAKLLEIQVMDLVAREVAEAYAQAQSRYKQIAIAEAGIQAALASFDLNLKRIRGGQGLPLEVLQSIQALDQARREYLRALLEYNKAQFRLYRALGWPVG